jgi:uncharacterized protein YlaI
MKEDLEKAVDLNLAARVMLACNLRNIKDPIEINTKRERVRQEIMRRIDEGNIGVEGLSELLDECVGKLELELDQKRVGDKSTASPPEPSTEEPAADRKQATSREPPKKSSGYQPSTADKTQRLANERKPIQTLLCEDCVQIGLLKPQRAEYLATQFAGKLTNEAEEEVLVELRNNLQEHVRRIIRKLNGGPWPTPKEQENLRVEIAEIPTVRSLLFLTREILREREEWLDKNSITGRLFGHRLKLGKGD